MRRLLEGTGLAGLVRKQISVFLQKVPCSFWKFTLRNSASVANNINISIVGAALSGIKALHVPNTSQ